MPQVRQYTRQVESAPIPGVRKQQFAIPHLETPPARVAATGAEAGVSRLAGTVAQSADEIWQREQQKQDQMRLLDAHKQMGDLENSLLYDPNTGAFVVRGTDAYGLPDTVSKSWDDATGKIRQGLGNNRQRLAFDEFNQQRKEEVMRNLYRHVDQERTRVDTQTLEGLVENETNAAIADPGVDRAEQAVSSISQAYQVYGEHYKQPKDVTVAAIGKAKSRIYSGMIERYLDNNLDIKARVFYEEHQKDINGEDRGKIEAAIKRGTTLGEAQRYGDLIIGGGGIGMLERPTITPQNTYERPILDNDTGEVLPPGSDVTGRRSYSTTSSMSFEEEGKEILVPTVIDGKRLSDEEAIAHYHKTGEHFGKFDNAEHADMYAEQLHNRQDRVVRGEGTTPTLDEMLGQASLIQDPQVRQATEERIRQHATAMREQQRFDEERNAKAAKKTLDDLETQIKNNLDRSGHAQTFEQVVSQSIRDKLPLSVEKGLREYWKQLTEQKEPKTDPGTFYDLYSLGTSEATKDQFARINLMRYVGKLSRGDFDKLTELQGKIRSGDDRATDQLSEGFRSVNEMVEDSLGLRLGHKPSPTDTTEYKELIQIHALVDQDIRDFEQREKKKPSKSDIQGFIDNHLIRGVTSRGFFSDTTKFPFEATPEEAFDIQFSDIPPKEVSAIESALARAGLPESERIIKQLYLAKIRKQKKVTTKP